MLYIHFGEMLEDTIVTPKSWLSRHIKDEWFETQLVKDIIKDVDKTECYGAYNMKSPVLGPINYTMLSNGTCNLIIATQIGLNHTLNATKCGDNCAKWLVRIAQEKDLKINLNYPMVFPEDFEAVVINDNSKIQNLKDYVKKVFEYL